MLDAIPDSKEMTALVGKSLYDVWNQLCALIDENYDMDCLWDQGGKAWSYEYKYRRGGKTLCALYARENCVGFMVILGRDERLQFEGVDQKTHRAAERRAQHQHRGDHQQRRPVRDIEQPGRDHRRQRQHGAD